jgi:4-hydroxythreonine-4-phosphate dehydrogenase
VRLVVTPGMGIGPEVALRALAAVPGDAVLVGDGDAIERANRGVGLPLVCVNALEEVVDGLPFLSPEGPEPAPVAAIRLGALACLAGQAAALVTGPIHKARLAAMGFPFRGHTGFLGHLCGVSDPVMAFVGARLKVALVTDHVPLHRVPVEVTAEKVARAGRLAAAALRDDLGLPSPRVAICGLNPHAGEGGLFGHEEAEVVEPAVRLLQAEGWDVRGPLSAEAAFLAALQGRVDLVVALYHDQGLAPLKAVDFGTAVNWTLGLPILRTSVDHGTADDLVGSGAADPGSMRAALDLARRIAARRQTRRGSPV